MTVEQIKHDRDRKEKDRHFQIGPLSPWCTPPNPPGLHLVYTDNPLFPVRLPPREIKPRLIVPPPPPREC